MDYQNNQMPQMPQQMPPQMPGQMPPQMYNVNMEEMRRRKKSALEAMGDKIAEFCQNTVILKKFIAKADIISYIVTCVCLAISILCTALNEAGTIVCGGTAILFGVFALSKRNVLPLALATSEVAAFTVVNIIMAIVNMAKISEYLEYYSDGGRYVTAFVFGLIFGLVELTVLVIFAVEAWLAFMATLEPKPYQPPMGYGQPGQYQQPPMGYGQPQQPAQFQQPAPQQFQQPTVPQYQQPVQPAAPVQPEAPAAPEVPVQPAAPIAPEDDLWVCTCGTVNSVNAKFCKSCGKPK